MLEIHIFSDHQLIDPVQQQIATDGQKTEQAEIQKRSKGQRTPAPTELIRFVEAGQSQDDELDGVKQSKEPNEAVQIDPIHQQQTDQHSNN